MAIETQAPSAQSRNDDWSWELFFKEPRNRLTQERISPYDAYRSLPHVARGAQRRQNELDSFLTDYFGKAELVVDKLKGAVLRLIGRNYEPLSIVDVVADQAQFIRQAEGNLGVLIEHSGDVIKGLCDYQDSLIGGRKEAAQSLDTVRTALQDRETSYRSLEEEIRDTALADPRYHQLYRRLAEVSREASELEVASIRAGADLGGSDANLAVINRTIGIATTGLKDATAAHAAFYHGAELLESLLPYLELSTHIGESRQWVVAGTKSASQAVGNAVGLSLTAYDSFSAVGGAARGFGNLPHELSKGLGAYSQRKDQSLARELGARTDTILSRRGI